jgi:hypothetical protein
MLSIEEIYTDSLKVEYFAQMYFCVSEKVVAFAHDRNLIDLWRLMKANKVDIIHPKQKFANLNTRAFTSILPVFSHTAFVYSDGKLDHLVIFQTSFIVE